MQKFRLFTTDERRDLTAMWRIAFPIMIQSLASTSVNLLDALMVGSLGDAALAAVNANTQFFSRFFHVILFGLGTGGGILIAQYWGVRDKKRIHQIMGIMLAIGAFLGIVFTVLTISIPETIIRFYSHDPEVIRLGVSYMKILSLTFFFYPFTMIFSSAHRSTGFTQLPMFTGTVAFLTNLLLNWLLIFGKFGFPRLGSDGAAIGTLAARLVEVILMIGITYRKKFPAAGKLQDFVHKDIPLIKNTMTRTLPVILNEAVWGTGINIYYAFYGRISTVAAAATAAVAPIDSFLFLAIWGLGDACGVLVGNELGRKKFDRAKRIARLAQKVNFICGLIFGAIVLALRSIILSAYSLSPEAISAATSILLICCLTLPIRALNYTYVIGILRSGGDVVFCMLLDLLSQWLVGIPMTALLATTFAQPVEIVYLGLAGEELSKFFFAVKRYRSGKWINSLTDA